jgi:hypothetical protein
MLIAFLYMMIIYYLQKTSRLDQLEYDMNTISAGDFTVELDITQTMYKEFLSEFYEPTGSKMNEEKSGQIYSPALYLKKYLSEEIGRMLTLSYINRLEREKEHELEHSRGKPKKNASGLPPVETIIVKDIQFAYNNHEVIAILKKRGYAIS